MGFIAQNYATKYRPQEQETPQYIAPNLAEQSDFEVLQKTQELQSQPQLNLNATQPKEPSYGSVEYYKANPNAIPQAPSLSGANSGKTQAKGFYDISRLKDEARQFIDNVRTGGDAFRSKDDLIKTQVARIQNDGGLIQTLTRSGEKTAENLKKNKANLDNLAKSHGYNLGAIIGDDGKIFFGKQNENGEIVEKEVTPSFLDDMGTYRNEILGGLAGAIATGGTSIPVALGASALGSSLGGGADFANRDDLTRENESAKDYLERMAWAGVDDLTAGLAMAGLLKGGSKAYNALKNTHLAENASNLAGKAWDNSGVSTILRHATTDNISGAESALNKAVGGEANAMQGLNQTRSALGDSAYNQFVNETNLNIPKFTGNETINKATDFLNEKVVEPIGATAKKILADENLNQREADLFLSALGNGESGANIIKNAIAKDPSAYEKASKIFTNLNSSAKANIDEVVKDTPSAVKVFDDYERRVKADYGAVMDTLSEFFTANPTATSETIKSSKRRILSNARAIFGDETEVFDKFRATLQRPTNLKEWQELRSIIGDEIGAIQKSGARAGLNTQDRNALRLLNEMKNGVDSAIDDIFNTYEKANPNLGARAKELMTKARAEYRTFKELETSDLWHGVTSGVKDESAMVDKLIKAVGNENGIDLETFLKGVGDKDRALIENSIIKNVVAKNTIDGATDFKAVNEILAKLPIETDTAKGIKSYLSENASILNNTSDILDFIKGTTPKGYELSQGISHKISSRLKVMVGNRLVNKIKSRIPVYGNNQALQNHINNAIKNSGDLNTMMKNIAELPSENLPSEARSALEAFQRDFASFKEQIHAEVKAEAKQDLKAELKAMANNGEIDLVKFAEARNAKLVKNSAEQGAKVADDEVDILGLANARNANLAQNSARVKNGFMDSIINATDNGADEAVDLSQMANNKQNLAEIKNGAYSQHAMLRPKDETIIKQNDLKLDKAREQIIKDTDISKLNTEQKEIYDVLIGDKEKAVLQGKDIKDIYTLEQGSRNIGARKILIKHGGVEKTGGLETSEMLDMMKIARDGEINADSFKMFDDRIRYAYELGENPKLRLVVDEYNDGKKVFDLYSDRNFVDYGVTPKQEIKQAQKTEKISNITKNINDTQKAMKELNKDYETETLEAVKYHIKEPNFAENLEKALQDDTFKALNDEYKAVSKRIKEIQNGSAKNSEFELSKLLEKQTDLADDLNSEFVKFSDPKFYADTIANRELSKRGKEAISAVKKEATTKSLPKNKDGKIYPNKRVIETLRELANFTDKEFIQQTLKRIGKATQKQIKIWVEQTATHRKDIELFYDIKPNPNFGTNYAEFYHDGIGAFNKIKAEKSGQVAGAFHRDDLGDIDLVWGVIKDENGKVQGYGLSKIVVKHKEITAELLDDIVKNGDIEVKDSRYSIVLNKDDKAYRVGLKSQYDGIPADNKFVITAYEVENKGGGKYPHTSTLASNDSPVTTLNNDIIPNLEKNVKSQAELKAKGDTSSEFYKDLQEQLKYIDKEVAKTKQSAKFYDKYLRLGGEVEARNVSERLSNRHLIKSKSLNEFKQMLGDDISKFSDDEISQMYAKMSKDGTYAHPLQTLDIPRNERVNLGDNTMAQSVELESKYLDKNGNISKEKLTQNAPYLPKSLNLVEFKKSILANPNTKRINHLNVEVKTPIESVNFNIATTFRHFNRVGKENRSHLTGVLMDTLTKPQFITQDSKGSRYYCKAFKGKNGGYDFVSVVADKDGVSVNMTNYNASLERLNAMIKEYDLLYMR